MQDDLPTNSKLWQQNARLSILIGSSQVSTLEEANSVSRALANSNIYLAIEVCSLDDSELSVLAKKTKVLIATTGPYALHGEPAFKACAENGTHYLDVTGEIPYVSKMIKKYEKTAKNSGAIMIPQTGVDSAPPDLITWTLAKMIREKLSAKTGDVVVSLHELR